MDALVYTLLLLVALYLVIGLIISTVTLITGGMRDIRMSFRSWPLWSIGCFLLVSVGWLPMLLVKNGSGREPGE